MGNDWQGKLLNTSECVIKVQKHCNLFQADEKLRHLGIGSKNFIVEVCIIGLFI
jgi:hypothetical protein